jgi:hypothetical protein
MKRLFPAAVALALFACGTAVAQVAFVPVPGAPTTRSMAPLGLTSPIPSAGGGLGAIRPNLGSLIPATGGALGSITTCPMTGMASSTADASMNVSGLLGTTTGTSAIAPFGTSALAGTCSPSAPAIAPGFSNAAPPPSPGTVTGPAFSDGALPLDATEAVGAGLSPMIAVPDPATSATSCNGGSTMIEGPSLPPETPSLPTLSNNAGVTGLSVPYGC